MNIQKWVLAGLLVLAVNTHASETLTFDTVEHLAISDALIVTLEEAEVTQIQVSGSAEAMEKLEADSRSGKLTLKNTRKFWHFFSTDKAREYTVQIPQGSLRRLSLSGSSKLEASQLMAKELSLDVSGAGHLYLERLVVDSLALSLGGASKVDIKRLVDPLSHLQVELSGSSHLQLPALSTTEARVQASGSSNILLKDLQAQNFDVHLSGASSLKVKGSGAVHQQRLESSGASDYRADDLLVQQAQVSASGASNIRLQVTDSLNATLSGGSGLRYAGNPRAHINSSGGSHAEAL